MDDRVRLLPVIALRVFKQGEIFIKRQGSRGGRRLRSHNANPEAEHRQNGSAGKRDAPGATIFPIRNPPAPSVGGQSTISLLPLPLIEADSKEERR